MSNILKVTTPVAGYENAVNKQNLSPSENMNIKNQRKGKLFFLLLAY